MPTIERPGAIVAYDVVGSGPPVILGHSLFCTRSMWLDVIQRLAGDFSLINIELRGHGESTAEAPFTLDDLVGDWLAIMDELGVDTAFLCGLSTGGMTAMRVAARAPERVTALALLDTNAAPETALNRLQYTVLGWAYSNLGLLPRKTLLTKMYSKATLTSRPELGEAFLEQVRRLDRRRLGYAMKAVFGRGSFDPRAIACPTTVVVGEHDLATPPACARKIVESIEGASLEIVEAAGHLTAQEQPEVVAMLLRRFFAKCSS